MDLFFARPGDIVVAKIDLKNGAVGIIPNWEDVVVTGHFAVYEPDLDMVIPEYFHLLVQTAFFKEYLWRNKVGAEGRKEVKLDFFLSIEVPLPSLRVQQLIVGHWRKAQQSIDSAKQALTKPVMDLEKGLREIYRRAHKRSVIGTRYFVVDFKDLEGWDVKSGRAAAFRVACPTFRRMGEFIEDATEPVRPFEQPDHDWPVYGVNNKEGVFFNCYRKGGAFNVLYKRIRQDWFFHNPTRCNVGSLGIVPEVPDDAITSPEYQVWRIKENAPEPLIPGYVAVLIQTPFFIDLVQFNRVGTVKQRMYFDNLCEVRIPYIPKSEQRKYADDREQALEQLRQANRQAGQVKNEIEEMILGKRPVY
jgi:hypothetical protein